MGVWWGGTPYMGGQKKMPNMTLFSCILRYLWDNTCMKITTTNATTRTKTESTDMLARLLASEDLTVQHSKDAHTAMMNVETRVLILPVWKEMSGSLYDMLTMHEVGHALFTPANGWSDCAAIDPNENNWPIVQMFYNIVEDARIERLMQDKFPGGRADFVAAYENLHNERNLFEIQGVDLSTLGLADRINLHFKLGILDLVEVPFAPEEMVFVDAIAATETWDDVTEVTGDLYDYCKKLDKENPQPKTAQAPAMPQDGDTSEGEESDTPQQPSVPNFDHGDDDDTDDAKGTPVSSDEDGDEAGEQGAGAGEETDEVGDDAVTAEGGSADGADDADGEDSGASTEDDTDDGESADSTEGDATDSNTTTGEGSETGSRSISSEIPRTVEAQNRNMEDLRDARGNDFRYLDAPKVDDKMIIDYTELHIDNAEFNQKFGRNTGFELQPDQADYRSIDTAFANFINRNKKTVNKMSQQFEMKKAADQFKRTRSAKSGRLDTNKMINYKWSDDIFAKTETITDGKNHGLVMYVDWSGSMSSCMKNTIEQMLCLVLFCKKVDIPFEVYSFTSVAPDCTDDDRWGHDKKSLMTFGNDTDPYRQPNYCVLNNYMSSRMKKSEYVNAMKNMLVLADGMSQYGRRGRHDLGGTPLNECILAARDIMLKFKKTNNVQVAHTIFLTDGDACGDLLHSYNTTTIWKERKHGWNYKSTKEAGRNYNDCTTVLLDWYKQTTGSRVVNFFITSALSRSFQWKYFADDVDGVAFKKAKKTFNKDNLVSAGAGLGFDETFLIKSNVEVTNETGLENITPDATAMRLKNAFIKGQNARVASRVLLSRFTDLIAD
jgi:hypothetical protein